ncbi:hypothetical protein DFJ73DRAFT_780704 [Zopfochytrium polystomum]|nr:hypothetical protein DFJ73DRAFT_780704 [Zopfochytrium polystomum]
MSKPSVKLLHHQLVNPVDFTRWMDYVEGHFARTFLKFTSAALHRLDEMKDAMELIVFTSLVLEM